jgi:hypothetical protein
MEKMSHMELMLRVTQFCFPRMIEVRPSEYVKYQELYDQLTLAIRELEQERNSK